ncbi:MAG: alanine dehydrogenase [Thiothrix sp.]
MRIGIPKEIKNHEYRVALTPDAVAALVRQGHEVAVQLTAGVGAGFTGADYEQAGAKLLLDARSVYNFADLIIKVKEPQPEEYSLLRSDHTLFCFLHLAANPGLENYLKVHRTRYIPFEQVRDGQGGLPILAPMSEIAGRLAVQAGAHWLEKAQGGAGVLLAGVPGVEPGKVLVIGAGNVGTQAAIMAAGQGARVVVLDRNRAALQRIQQLLGFRVETALASPEVIRRHLPDADLVVGAVLVPGQPAPKVISRDDLQLLRPGRVLVDVAIDEGGCFATSRPTTHTEPVFEMEGCLHYCVANMPGVVPQTASRALSAMVLRYLPEVLAGTSA